MVKLVIQISNLTKGLILALSLLAINYFLFTSEADAQVDPNLHARLLANPIVIDHNDVGLFDQIPDQYIQRAKSINMTFMDRSVGDNINSGLNCLVHDWSHQTTAACKRDVTEGYYGVKADNYYTRANWEFYWSPTNLWNEITTAFFTEVVPNRLSQDILTFQINYLALANDSHVNDAPGSQNTAYSPGFFYGYPQTANRYDISDVEAWQAANPNRIFFHWTASLARNIGTYNSTVFNDSMRSYANSHHQILLDYADIMSHDLNGQPCYDNITGDGADYPAICTDYTSEINGGHLGSMATGTLRIAKAYWVLMAKIAGWNPDAAPLPTSTPGVTAQPTLSPTLVTSSPTPSPTSRPGDANTDGYVDGVDYVIWLSHFGENTQAGYAVGDFNLDSNIDGIDYVIWLNNYTPHT